MEQEQVELNAAYPVKVGWRYICVRKIEGDFITLCLIGVAGKPEEITLQAGGIFSLDEADYRVLSIHHPTPVPEGKYSPKNPRRVAAIISKVLEDSADVVSREAVFVSH